MAVITSEEKYKPANVFVSKPLDLSTLDRKFKRADIQFIDVDHSGASYQARVFLDNPNANEKTALTLENGYAGLFHIFGHGGCYGDEGHCEVPLERRMYDPRPAHPLTPALKIVTANEAIRRCEGKNQVTVTVVPLLTAATEQCDLEDVFLCRQIRIITYR